MSQPSPRPACRPAPPSPRSRPLRRRLEPGVLVVAALALFTVAAPARADFTAGDLLGTVTDIHGNRVAAAAVTLSGGGETHRGSTDADGLFRIDNLAPGNYTIEVESDGFSKAVYNPVNVRIGRMTRVEVRLAPSVEETIVVTSEPPGSRFGDPPATLRRGDVDLAGLPSGDDPFAAAAELPGVVVERPGPGHGQGGLAGPGAGPKSTRWAVDGVDVTDPHTGRPASFVSDLDLVAAVEVGAGGNDVAVVTPGLRVDLVTRRGTDEARFAVRGARTDRDWQSQPAEASEVSLIEGATDLGGEGGGRLVRDRLWGWGGLELQEVDRRAVGGLAESSRVETLALKLDAIPLSGSSLDLAYHRGKRRREGVGAGPDRSFQATQRELEPSRLLRLEEAQVFGADFLLTGRLARVESDSSLLPEGPEDAPVVLGPDGVWHGSFGTFRYGHRSDLGSLEAVAHRRTGTVQHELRTGLSRRDSRVSSAEHWGAGGYQQLDGANFGTPFDVLRVVRRSEVEIDQGQTAFWAQETGRWRGFTLDLGVRFDEQSGRLAEARAEASAVVPELLPAVDLSTQPTAFRWSSLSPRFALAWAPGRQGRTVFRIGYSSFATELDPDLVTLTNPVTSEVLFGVASDDPDGDKPAPTFDRPLAFLQGINYSAVGKGGNRLDPRLAPERTSELRLAADHRFANGFEIGVDRVERTVSNLLEAIRLVIGPEGQLRTATASDYELDFVHTGLLPDGSPYSAPVYRLRPAVRDAGGTLVRNGDRSQRYAATSLRFTRHLRHGLLLRGHVTWSDWRWHVGDGFRNTDDPTNTGAAAVGPAGIASADGDGEIVIPPTEDGIFLESRWAWNLLGLWQVAPERGWGFDLGVHVHGRQGYPIPYSVAVVGSDGIVRSVEPTSADRFRLEDLYTVDLRLEKEVEIRGLRTTFALDGFNLFDRGSVIARETRLGTPLGGTVRETLAPRVLRLGVRVAFD